MRKDHTSHKISEISRGQSITKIAWVLNFESYYTSYINLMGVYEIRPNITHYTFIRI